MRPGGGGNEVYREVARMLVAFAHFALVSCFGFDQARTAYRLQTACRRYCPWEPTAASIDISWVTRRSSIAINMTTTSDL